MIDPSFGQEETLWPSRNHPPETPHTTNPPGQYILPFKLCSRISYFQDIFLNYPLLSLVQDLQTEVPTDTGKSLEGMSQV